MLEKPLRQGSSSSGAAQNTISNSGTKQYTTTVASGLTSKQKVLTYGPPKVSSNIGYTRANMYYPRKLLQPTSHQNILPPSSRSILTQKYGTNNIRSVPVLKLNGAVSHVTDPSSVKSPGSTVTTKVEPPKSTIHSIHTVKTSEILEKDKEDRTGGKQPELVAPKQIDSPNPTKNEHKSLRCTRYLPCTTQKLSGDSID